MKRLKVLVLESAAADLINIYRYIEAQSGSPQTARRFLDRIEEACRRVGDMPMAGRSRDDLLPGLRLHAWRKTVIIAYRITEEAVEIVNIFYGGRDYEAIYHPERDVSNDG